MTKLSITDLDLTGKRVFIRVDFNVPVDGGKVSDDTRIRAAIPTIKYAFEHGAKVILASHLGRPKGKPDTKYSLAPVAKQLSSQLGQEVPLAPDCIGPEVKKMVDDLQDGQAILLENLRFHAEEEKNDEGFARELASLADHYVNDAFGTAHRAHASTVGMTKFVSQSAAGLLMQKELEYLGKVLVDPEKPFVVILGGAKVSDKIEIIQNLLKTADALLIGGAMAYTFLKANRVEIGQSLVELDKLELARNLEKEAKQKGVKLILPMDHVVVDKSNQDAAPRTIPIGKTRPGQAGLDIGLGTVKLFSAEIEKAKMVLWNGPMGMFELKPFDRGTVAVARSVANSTATSIVGGGDSVAAVTEAGVADKISHISTGGGASLEFLSGIELPGVAALTNK